MTREPFEQLVFSGGGTRCFWHGGFLEVVREPLELQPQRVTGVSGGALSAACFIAKRGRKLLQIMGDAFENTSNNVQLMGNGKGEGLTPHQEIYREVVEATLDDDAQQSVANGPQFQVLVAYPPSTRLPKWSTLLIGMAYFLDIKIRSKPAVKFPQLLGLTSELVDARQAASEGKLVDLICNAAVIPPVFNLQGWNGKKVIDGAFACKAPMPTHDSGRTLILITRQFRNLPSDPRLNFVEVSEETPADKLDFTDRTKIEATWELGRNDGKNFLLSELGTD